MKKVIVTLLSLVLIISYACSDSVSDNLIENIAPETNISIFTQNEINKQQSRLTVHWWGDDPDGLVVGYYFTWDGTNWSFTEENDSLFALIIGASDTAYTFQVAAVDNGGNNVYDSSVERNGINLGPEPFIDANNDGVYNSGEKFYDIGLVDPTPASQAFPIQNTAPTIEWNEFSILPDTSYPVMTIRWEADDVDGIESINAVKIALNDTTNPVSLNGEMRIVTLRTDDFASDNPEMEIYLNGLSSNVHNEKLAGLKYNDNNKIYIWAEDISGAKSEIITLPDSSGNWFVKRPKGKVLLLDDYADTFNDRPNSFYFEKFDSVLSGNYDYVDLRNANLPFENTTLLETMKLYDAVYWYSNNPSLDIAAEVVPQYLNNDGKIAFSMIQADVLNEELLTSFVPVDSVKFVGYVFSSGEFVSADSTNYPHLYPTSSINNVRVFYPSPGNETIYTLDVDGTQEVIGFKDSDNSLIYMGMPLHKTETANGSSKAVLDKIFIEEFGIVL